MSIFQKIREHLKTKEMKKQLKYSMAEYEKKQAQSLSLSLEEFTALSDDDLIFVALARTEKKVDEFDDLKNGFDSLNQSQKVFYSLNWLESEVNNGGLCQFFVNSSRMVAPLVSGYMEIVGAAEHKKLYDEFVEKNKIDLTDLSYFDIDEVDEFEEKTQAYPFDEYDDAFCNMEPIETYLKKYIREHITDF